MSYLHQQLEHLVWFHFEFVLQYEPGQVQIQFCVALPLETVPEFLQDAVCQEIVDRYFIGLEGGEDRFASVQDRGLAVTSVGVGARETVSFQ